MYSFERFIESHFNLEMHAVLDFMSE